MPGLTQPWGRGLLFVEFVYDDASSRRDLALLAATVPSRMRSPRAASRRVQGGCKPRRTKSKISQRTIIQS
eukprot:4769368-Amphidinium_carterae.1